MVLSLSEYGLKRSMKCYDAVVTEATWIWKIIYLYSGKVDLLKVWSEQKKKKAKRTSVNLQ